MTFVLRLALNTLVLPVVPVAIAVAVAFATRSATARRCAGALAAASGIVVAHVVVVGVPRLPPIDTIGWIPFAAAVTCVGLLVEPRPVVRLVVTFVVATIAIRLVGRPVWHSAIDAAPWALLVGAGTTAIDASLVVASRRMPPAGVLLAFAMTMAGGSIACLFGHSALLAQVLGASAAVIGASGVVAIFVTPAKTPAKTIASIAAVSAVAVMAYASLYATLSTVVVVLLVGSAVAPIVAAALPVTPRARAVVAVAMAIALAAAAAVQ